MKQELTALRDAMVYLRDNAKGGRYLEGTTEALSAAIKPVIPNEAVHPSLERIVEVLRTLGGDEEPSVDEVVADCDGIIAEIERLITAEN